MLIIVGIVFVRPFIHSRSIVVGNDYKVNSTPKPSTIACLDEVYDLVLGENLLVRLKIILQFFDK